MEQPRNQNSQTRSLDSPEEEITLYLKVIKTLAFKIRRSETIKNLKASLCDKEGTSENLQELFFAGDRLNDDQRLVDYGIQKDSTLHVFLQNKSGMKIFVKIPSNGKTIEVEARIYDTIENIKSIILTKEGIQSDQYTLFYAGKQLQDDRTLASHGLQRESTLHLVFNPKDIMSFSVKTPTGEIVNLKAKVLYYVSDVKAIVSGMIGMSISDQNLMLAGKQLEDSETLASYNIKEDSILEISSPTIQIFVKAWSGKTITLDVYQSDAVQDVKDKIFQKLGVPAYFQSIVFKGKQLDVDCHLEDYNIHKHATLHVVFSPSTIITKMTLYKIGGSALDVPDSTMSICDLKAMIQKKMSAPVKEVYLRGKALRDEFSLADYGIGQDEMLTIVSEKR